MQAKYLITILILLNLMIKLPIGVAFATEPPYLITNNNHTLAVTATLKDVNANITEGVLVSYSPLPAESPFVMPNSTMEVTDHNGNVKFIFTATSDVVFVNGERERTFHFNLAYNDDTYPIQFLLRNGDYYDRVEITIFEQDGFVTPAFIQIISGSNDEPRAGTLSISGGARGSIIHTDIGGIYNGGILEGFEVPAAGLNIWFTNTQENTQGNFVLSFAASNFPATISTPVVADIPRTIETVASSSVLGANYYTEAQVIALIGQKQILEMNKVSRLSVREIRLPVLTPASRGVTIISENGSSRSMAFVDYTNNDRYTVSGSSLVASQNKCIHKAIYWSGSRWLAITDDRVPRPEGSHPNCFNSNVFLD